MLGKEARIYSLALPQVQVLSLSNEDVHDERNYFLTGRNATEIFHYATGWTKEILLGFIVFLYRAPIERLELYDKFRNWSTLQTWTTVSRHNFSVNIHCSFY